MKFLRVFFLGIVLFSPHVLFADILPPPDPAEVLRDKKVEVWKKKTIPCKGSEMRCIDDSCKELDSNRGYFLWYYGYAGGTHDHDRSIYCPISFKESAQNQEDVFRMSLYTLQEQAEMKRTKEREEWYVKNHPCKGSEVTCPESYYNMGRHYDCPAYDNNPLYFKWHTIDSAQIFCPIFYKASAPVLPNSLSESPDDPIIPEPVYEKDKKPMVVLAGSIAILSAIALIFLFKRIRRS